MAIEQLFNASFLRAERQPAVSPDSTGQLLHDASGQPIGDATVDDTDWSTATPLRGRMRELNVRWPDGPGAGAELVKVHMWFRADADVEELDKLKRVDVTPNQAYQVTFVKPAEARLKRHHKMADARRIPL